MQILHLFNPRFWYCNNRRGVQNYHIIKLILSYYHAGAQDLWRHIKPKA